MFGYDFTPIDWSAQSGTVDLPEGKCYLVTEGDMQYVNSLSLKISGTLVLSNATTDSKFDVGVVHSGGSWGTIVKMGESRQSFKSGIWRFGGTLRIEEGTAVYTTAYAFGDTQNNGNVYVCEGATAELASGSYCFCNRAFHISGTGYQGQGALLIKKAASTIQKLYLDGDASVVSEVESNFVVNYPTGSGRFAAVDPAVLELNGHTLTLGGTSPRIGLANCNVTDSVGTGGIIYAAADSGDRVVRFSGAKMSLAAPIVFEGDTTVQLYNSCAPIASPVTANGSLTFTYACDSGAGAGLTDAYNKWTGDIAFTASGSVLRFTPSNANYQLTLTGNVSGDANLEVGTSGAPASGIVRLCGHNTYTGNTVVYGTDDLVVQALYNDSVPDTAKMTVNGGIVVRIVGVEDGAYTLTPSDYLDYVAPQIAGKTGIGIPLETSALTNGDYTFTAALMAEKLVGTMRPFWKISGDDGQGTVSYSGNFTADDPLSLTISSGRVRLTGDDTINLGSVTVTGTADNQGGTLDLEDAKDVTFGADTLTLGNVSSASPNTRAKMTIKDSSLSSTNGTLWVGRYTQGLLKIDGDSVVSNKIYVGGSQTDSDGGSGVGAVWQRGGMVYPTGLSIATGASHGSYELRNGAVDSATTAMEIGRYGTGVFMQYGGNVVARKGTSLAPKDKAYGIYYLRNGTFCNESGTFSASYGRYESHAEITVEGPDAEFIVRAESYYNNNSTRAGTIINLNDGGVFETRFLSYSHANTATIPFPLILNFNGGIFRRGYFYANPIGNVAGAVSKVAVYEKGAGFNTYYNYGGSTYTSANTQNVTFEGAKGNGIRAVRISEPLTGYVAAPYVSISGDGYGATAVAEIDFETATVTNIVVTSHGWGYTAENTTVTLMYNRAVKHTFAPEDVVIAPNEVGGFTKYGIGTLSLYSTNSWEKWTCVKEGTLKVMTNGAIPPNTELILNGATKTDATLDLNGFDENADRPTTFSGVSGTGGTVKNGIVKIVGEWKVSAKKFVDRETTDVAGTVDLTDCTGIAITDAEALDESAKELRPLVLFKATTVIGLDGITITDVPNGWKVTKVANGFRMSADKGMMLLVR